MGRVRGVGLGLEPALGLVGQSPHRQIGAELHDRLHIVAIDGAQGVILPADVLAQLGAGSGGTIDLLVKNGEVLLRAHDSGFAMAMAAAVSGRSGLALGGGRSAMGGYMGWRCAND